MRKDSMHTANTISIIIVNWNAGSQLMETVFSITQFHYNLVTTVIIVDNASTDNSLLQVEMLQELPFQLRIIRNIENRGFAAACNQGEVESSSDYLLFLNPDTRLFKNSLTVPLAFMRDIKHKNVGIVGIQLINEHNKIARSCARFPSLNMFVAQALGLNHLPILRHLNTHMSDWEHSETREVDHVIGAFYLIRRSLFDSLSGFDEHFFVYLEDLDLSLRAHQAGWRSVYLTEAQAFHAGGGTSKQVKVHRLFYSLRSRLFYGFKHFSLASAWGLLFTTLVIEPWSRLGFSLFKGRWCDIFYTLQAYFLLIRNLSKIVLFLPR
jgi:GT2 family glycosyltransferase